MAIPVETHWTDTQKKLIAITPKFSSFLSFIGSSYIIYHCMTSNYITNNRNSTSSSVKPKGRGLQNPVYNRILMALSFCDLISSMGWFLSTWPIPKDDDQGISVYNIGNRHVCDLQGFLLQFGNLAGACYNTCLSVYFRKIVQNKIDKRKTNNGTKMEIIFHFISLVFPLSAAIYILSSGHMNPTPSNCFTAEYPRGCLGDECIRGENYKRIRIFFALIPVMICFIIITASMIRLHSSVKELVRRTVKKASENISVNNTRESNKKAQEEKNSAVESSLVDEKNRMKEKKISLYSNIDIRPNNENVDLKDNAFDFEKNDVKREETQSGTSTISKKNEPNKNILISQASKKLFGLAVRYILAFLSVWVPILFQLIITKVFVDNVQLSFWSHLVLDILGPLQGFFNAMIYRGFNPLSFLYGFLCAPCSLLFEKQEAYNSEDWSYEYEYYFDDED